MCFTLHQTRANTRGLVLNLFCFQSKQTLANKLTPVQERKREKKEGERKKQLNVTNYYREYVIRRIGGQTKLSCRGWGAEISKSGTKSQLEDGSNIVNSARGPHPPKTPSGAVFRDS